MKDEARPSNASVHATRSERERRLNAVAHGQHRIVTTRRLRSLGFDSGAVHRRTIDGRLRRLYPGVYLVGPGEPTRVGRWLAAVLACGDGALLRRRSAGALWNLVGLRGSKPETLIPYARCVKVRGVSVQRSRLIHADDRAMMSGIPVTSIERTLVDLASDLSSGDLKRALEQAESLRLVDWRTLEAAVGRAQGRPGVGALRALLGYDPAPANETRSELERRFFRIVTEAGLPPYGRNVVVEGIEVDAFWAEARVVVELQSYAFHSDKDTFITDHRKNAKLQAAGHRVLPVTDDQTRRPDELVATLAALGVVA